MIAIFLDATTPALPADWFNVLVGGGTAGLIAGLVILTWLLITERLVPGGRLTEANDRTEKAETQRDEAIALSRQQVDVNKDLVRTTGEILDRVRDQSATRRTR